MSPSTTDRRRSTPRLLLAFVTMLATLTAGMVTAVVGAAPASAATICEQYGTVDAGSYVIQNNRWGTGATQCIDTTANGFTITQQDGVGNTSGTPVSYPSIFLGCHYSTCSPGTPLPKQLSTIGSAPTSIGYTYTSSGTYNASYDIWLNANTDVSGVQDTEIMIWFNRQGSIQPIGSQTGTATIAGRTWAVWTGNNGSNNVVSYVSASPIGSLSFDVMGFVDDTFTRGAQYGDASWYLTSVQAGFEPWIGGVGLTVNSFSASVTNGGGTEPTVPGAPGTPTTSNVTSSGLTLGWAAASGTVTGYQVERATGSGDAWALVGSPAATTFTDTGLAAGTTYRYRVRAVNGAGTSAYSPVTTVTTSLPDGGGSAGCTTSAAVQNQWTGGYTLTVTVTNSGTSSISGWRSTVTLPAGHTHAGSWPAAATVSGQTVTEASQSWNGSLAPGQSVTWGLQATRPTSDSSVPTAFACTTP
ncbi:cellulose binding domain-containing protein [Antribacter sp. KLBMP9083]|uniref:Cellulose binding domain-containing protein n=1 Tax=Antribacter soli TaxID=2910976 RepID=A0AA41QGZ1_9MICO|nr:cellulose binding domain-containing protein [Antribacter soli]MCF4122921.1 cellulose binding domain-containing protein [Antribacter soli]